MNTTLTTVIIFACLFGAVLLGMEFLILELDQPFGGLIQISSEPMLNALSYLVK